MYIYLLRNTACKGFKQDRVGKNGKKAQISNIFIAISLNDLGYY